METTRGRRWWSAWQQQNDSHNQLVWISCRFTILKKVCHASTSRHIQKAFLLSETFVFDMRFRFYPFYTLTFLPHFPVESFMI